MEIDETIITPILWYFFELVFIMIVTITVYKIFKWGIKKTTED